jgi:hypothetical protein
LKISIYDKGIKGRPFLSNMRFEISGKVTKELISGISLSEAFFLVKIDESGLTII